MNEIVEKYTRIQELDQLINLLQVKKTQLLETEFNQKFEQLRKLLKLNKKPYKRLPNHNNLINSESYYFFKTKNITTEDSFLIAYFSPANEDSHESRGCFYYLSIGKLLTN